MINIIGASVAGNNLAWKLAKIGHKVAIFEDHAKVGTPLHCTGVVTHEFQGLVQNKEFIVNKIKKIKLISKKNNLILDLKKPELILDRPAFDNFLLDKALDSGAEIRLNSRFIGLNKDKIKVKEKNGINEYKKRILVGADGASSTVFKSINPTIDREYYVGLEAKAKLDVDPNIFECHFGSDFPEFFGWVVPENNGTVRIGLATKKDTASYFDKFLRDRLGKDFKKIIFHRQAGLIPMHDPKIKTQLNSIYLVGDSALQNKTSTGGGIIPSLICSNTLSECIDGNGDYEKAWRKKIGTDLKLHLKIRKFLDRFSDEDYDKLLKYCSNDKVKNILEAESRDFPTRFMTRLVVHQPKFLYFLKYLRALA